jgi:hypothetical protein
LSIIYCKYETMTLLKINEPEPLIILAFMVLLPIIVFGLFHLKNNDFFDKFKRKKK